VTSRLTFLWKTADSYVQMAFLTTLAVIPASFGLALLIQFVLLKLIVFALRSNSAHR